MTENGNFADSPCGCPDAGERHTWDDEGIVPYDFA